MRLWGFRFAGAALVLVACVLMTACPPKTDIVTIRYDQVGACNGFTDGVNLVSAGPKAAYVVFRVTTIENQDSGARDFNFDPNRVYINTSPRAYTSTRLNLAQMNPFYAVSRLVAKGTTAPSVVGAVIAIVPTVATDGAQEASKTSFFLLYDSPAGGQGVVLVKNDPNRTVWPYIPDCLNITY